MVTKRSKGVPTPTSLFSKAQDAPMYKQNKYQQQMMAVMKEVDNEEEFSVSFHKPLLCLLASPYNTSFARRMIQFSAGFLVDVIIKENEEGCETLGVFLQRTFNFLFQIGKLDDKNMRFNVCIILNQLLHEIAKQELDVEDELCNKIILLLTERICDKQAGIREEAAKALQWLQDESKPDCNVTKTLLYHMERDPSSEVRRAILKEIRVTPITLPAIVRRTLDVKDVIRVDAYKVLAERRKMTSLSFGTREVVIMSGLKDDSEAVRNTVISYLLPHWLGQMEGGLLQFVRELDSEIHPHVPRLVMQHLFTTLNIKDLLKPLQPEEGENCVNVERMDPPLALYWSCLAQYLKKDEQRQEECAAAFETIMPSVTELCNYIGMFFDTTRSKMEGLSGVDLEIADLHRVSTLIHLLELVDCIDLADEAGRQNLCNLLERILTSSEKSKRVWICVTKKLSLAYLDPCQRTNAILSIIEDLHKPLMAVEPSAPTMTEAQHRSHQVEMAKTRVALCNLQVAQEKAIDLQDFLRAAKLKEDIKEKRVELEILEKALQPTEEVEMERGEVWDLEVMFKCLTILVELMRNSDVFKASIGLADVIDNLVLKCLSCEDDEVRPLAIEIMGIYCLQRLSNAKKSLPIFYAMLNHDVNCSNETKAICVRCICAIIVHHGLKPFDIPEEEPIFAPEARVRLNTSVKPELSFFSSISYLMDDTSETVRTEATIGLCKMVMSGRITSVPLLSKLILLWFNPTTRSNKRLMKMLGRFLSYYPTFHFEAPKWLVQTLIPTLDMLLEAPHSSSLIDIDSKEVGLFILDMTRPGRNKHYKENPHDELAHLLLERISEEIAGDTVTLLLRLCINLQITVENNEFCLNLLKQVKKLKRDNLGGNKNKDLDKLLVMLRNAESSGTDSSQLAPMDSETLSQDSQDSDVTTVQHPSLVAHMNGMEIDSSADEESRPPSVVQRKPVPRPRSKRPAQHVSESDTE